MFSAFFSTSTQSPFLLQITWGLWVGVRGEGPDMSRNRARAGHPVKVEEAKGIGRVMGNTKGGSCPTSCW